MMDIIVLGTGCARCKNLEAATKQAVTEMGIDATISKEEDIVKIMQYGVMQTPGLVINGKVVSQGHLLSNSQLKEIITKNQ
jgi:small redox-active disulfide protein 2